MYGKSFIPITVSYKTHKAPHQPNSSKKILTFLVSQQEIVFECESFAVTIADGHRIIMKSLLQWTHRPTSLAKFNEEECRSTKF